MDFQSHFRSSLEALKDEGNYRIFAELERRCGLITGEEYATIYRTCLSEQIRPRFARRGITIP